MSYPTPAERPLDLERETALRVVGDFVQSILDGDRGGISADRRALYEDVMRLVEWIHELRARAGVSLGDPAENDDE